MHPSDPAVSCYPIRRAAILSLNNSPSGRNESQLQQRLEHGVRSQGCGLIRQFIMLVIRYRHEGSHDHGSGSEPFTHKVNGAAQYLIVIPSAD